LDSTEYDIPRVICEVYGTVPRRPWPRANASIRVTSDRSGHPVPEARAAMAEALEGTYRNAPAA